MLLFKGLGFSYPDMDQSDFKKILFIINIKLTSLAIRALFSIGDIIGFVNRRVWFVCHSRYFSAFAARYATASGCGYCVFDWMGGTLTNMSRIFSFFYGLYVDWVKGYRVTQSHKMFLFRLLSFGLGGLSKPALVLFPRMVESKQASFEMGVAVVGSSAIIDSDHISSDIRLPIPGNDDSVYCVNFISFYFAKLMVAQKIVAIRKFGKLVKMSSNRYMWLRKLFLIFWYFPFNWQELTQKYFDFMRTVFDVDFQYKFNDRISEMEPVDNHITFMNGIVTEGE